MLNEHHKRLQYVQKLNLLLDKHDFGVSVSINDFSFIDASPTGLVTDATKEGRFSRQLISKIARPINTGTFYHYTSLSSASSILKNKNLRLYSIRKRIHEGELIEFLQQFDYEYPLQNDSNGEPRYKKSLTEGVFYISLCNSKSNARTDQHLWDEFAKGDGARFKLEIECQHGCLREITYDNDARKWANFFREVCELTKTELGRVFYMEDSAVFCAYFLPNTWRKESETRLLFNKSWRLAVKNDGQWDYSELLFGDNSHIGTKVKLLEVQSNQPLVVPAGVKLVSRPMFHGRLIAALIAAFLFISIALFEKLNG